LSRKRKRSGLVNYQKKTGKILKSFLEFIIRVSFCALKQIISINKIETIFLQMINKIDKKVKKEDS